MTYPGDLTGIPQTLMPLSNTPSMYFPTNWSAAGAVIGRLPSQEKSFGLIHCCVRSQQIYITLVNFCAVWKTTSGRQTAKMSSAPALAMSPPSLQSVSRVTRDGWRPKLNIIPQMLDLPVQLQKIYRIKRPFWNKIDAYKTSLYKIYLILLLINLLIHHLGQSELEG